LRLEEEVKANKEIAPQRNNEGNLVKKTQTLDIELDSDEDNDMEMEDLIDDNSEYYSEESEDEINMPVLTLDFVLCEYQCKKISVNLICWDHHKRSDEEF